MGMYSWLPLPTPADFDALSGLLDLEYDPGRVARILREGVSPAVKGVLIERGYVDKDYRSTLYNFYSKMGRPYSPDCVRLHFFSGKVTFDQTKLDLSPPPGDSIDEHYFGYMVLRPTIAATIGRTVLSPSVRVGAAGAVTASQHSVHLLGYRLRVWGFPSMDQHADIAVCAHVACWSILRHYSERYPQHQELLVHDITLMAHGADPGGLVPANGFDVSQAERVFQGAGTFPLIVTKPTKGSETFYWQLLAYLESGFPLFVSIDGKYHALALVGRVWSDDPPLVTMGVPMHAWDRVSSLLVADDHHLPYRCIPATGTAASKKEYTAADFERFIVPLPEKIFYPAEAVARHADAFAKVLRRYMPMPDANEIVLRYFVTTVSSLRAYVRANADELCSELVTAIMQTETAQFVWIIEYASARQWRDKQVAVRAVVDATATPQDPSPAWFAHGANSAIFFDRTRVHAAATSISWSAPDGSSLRRMDLQQNLRDVVAKT